jgi:hypothetical protein
VPFLAIGGGKPSYRDPKFGFRKIFPSGIPFDNSLEHQQLKNRESNPIWIVSKESTGNLPHKASPSQK